MPNENHQYSSEGDIALSKTRDLEKDLTSRLNTLERRLNDFHSRLSALEDNYRDELREQEDRIVRMDRRVELAREEFDIANIKNRDKMRALISVLEAKVDTAIKFIPRAKGD